MSAARDIAPAVRTAFGRVLQELRRERGLSQETVAELAGIDRTTPSLLERGLRQPTLVLLILLAHALEVDPRELVGRVLERLERKGVLARLPYADKRGRSGNSKSQL
jgi:transcriptional regulator with XRE-family HTH domain